MTSSEMIRTAVFFTDGYRFEHKMFNTEDEAEAYIAEEYKSYNINEPNDEWDEMSECHGSGAILYNGGNDVYIWTSLPVTEPAYYLMVTNGYGIRSIGKFSTRHEAATALKLQYNNDNNNEPDSEWDDQSYCGELDATLYNNGEDVYHYEIIFIPLYDSDTLLEPCPFCGSAPVITQDENKTYWRITCSDRHCIIGADLKNHYLSEEDAINAWQKRNH